MFPQAYSNKFRLAAVGALRFIVFWCLVAQRKGMVILMEKETMGTVISVTKQWWLKVNRKPVRAHAMDGAAFPHTIKVKYTIDGKDYICRKWIGAGNKVPDKGTTIKVTYCEDKPSKARIEL